MIHAFVLGATMAILLGLAGMRPFVGLLAFDWISFMNPQQVSWGLGATVPWAQFAALATVIGCLVAGEPKRLPINAMTVLIAIFLLLVSISTAYALTPPQQLYPMYLLVVKSFGFMILACALLTTRKRIHALIWLMVLSVGYYGVRGGLFVLLTGGVDHVYGPPNTMIGDNNQLAVALLVTLPLMNYLRKQSEHRLVRAGLVAAMALTLIAVVGTYSRGGLLALGAMTVFLWWNSRAKLAAALALIVGLGLALAVMPPQWAHRMNSIEHYKTDQSAEERIVVWREATGMAMARPFVGGGLNATLSPDVMHRFYPDARQRAAHSIWFGVLGDLGFPALIVWTAMQIVGVRNAWVMRQYARGDPTLSWIDDLGRMAQVSIVAFLVGGSFLSLSYYDFYFMLLMILAAVRTMIATQPLRGIATRGVEALPPWRARVPAGAERRGLAR